uniref:Uncharacterized protein n=1 Tax=Arundo donax TaxID=35708 RepID=A0A0A9CU97_ARUDO
MSSWSWWVITHQCHRLHTYPFIFFFFRFLLPPNAQQKRLLIFSPPRCPSYSRQGPLIPAATELRSRPNGLRLDLWRWRRSWSGIDRVGALAGHQQAMAAAAACARSPGLRHPAPIGAGGTEGAAHAQVAGAVQDAVAEILEGAGGHVAMYLRHCATQASPLRLPCPQPISVLMITCTSV